MIRLKRTKHTIDRKISKNFYDGLRTVSTIKRLKMYRKKAIRDKHGSILKEDLQSKKLPNTRIMQDRRWFGNSRTIGFRKMEKFKKAMSLKTNDSFAVFAKQNEIPMNLIKNSNCDSKIIKINNFNSSFGTKNECKSPKLNVDNLYELIKKANDRSIQYDKNCKDQENTLTSIEKLSIPGRSNIFEKGQSKRIWNELYKVIDSSDVVIQVLDSRDPLGTRSYHIEQYIKNNHSSKNIILLLNKCDLVPAWVLKKWLYFFSRSYPTLAFHANILCPYGKAELLAVLRQLCRLRSDKKSISVGFVGYPNVGKSSVINTLKGKRVCTSAPIPGETKVWQFVTLISKINLIDSPGIVHNTSMDTDISTVLKGVIRIEKLENPEDYIYHLLNLVKPNYLKRAYQIQSWENVDDFLIKVANRYGKVIKGGEPNVSTTSRMILHDWQKGKLPYYQVPPENMTSAFNYSNTIDSVTNNQQIIKNLCFDIGLQEEQLGCNKEGYFLYDDLKEDSGAQELHKKCLKVATNSKNNEISKFHAKHSEREIYKATNDDLSNESNGYGEKGLEWESLFITLKKNDII